MPPNYQLFKIPSLVPHLGPSRSSTPPQLDPTPAPAPQVLLQPHPYLLIVRLLQPFSRPLILTTSGFLTEQIDMCGSDGARPCWRAGDIRSQSCVPGTSSSSVLRLIFPRSSPSHISLSSTFIFPSPLLSYFPPRLLSYFFHSPSHISLDRLHSLCIPCIAST